MLIDEMHHEFDLRFDRVSSQDRADFYDNERDSYLNRAIKSWTNIRYRFNPAAKIGFESDQFRMSNLMSLHVEYPVQLPIVPVKHNKGTYEVRLRDLTFPYIFLTSARVTIEKDSCTKTIDHTNWQIDDRKNTFNEPNFEWGRVHSNFGKSTLASTENQDLYSIYFDTTDYKDEVQFNIIDVQLSYIKQPNRVCLGTYIHIDDLITVPPATSPVVHCDIPNHFHDEIVNIAVALASRDLADMQGQQTAQHLTEGEK